MLFDDAIRLTEILLALAFMQQSIEHLSLPGDEKFLFLTRLVLSVLLLAGVATPLVAVGLVCTGLMILVRFQGPYNGGSDRMGLLVLCCLALSLILQQPLWREYALGYLAVQLVLSYFISGGVKIVNPEWRSGRALQDVFRFSAYPVSESLRGWTDRPGLLRVMAWAVMLFELLFPLAFLTHVTLIAALCIALLFHVANACLFGLNRFVWVWLAAYPALLWLQGRLLPY